ncbi:MAG: CHASE2 domain-containing protein, partial [Myxococcota bacterium]
PRAVFIDLLFTHQHQDEPEAAFENLVQHLRGDRGRCGSDAPIFVADLADQVHYRVANNSVVHERLRDKAKVKRVPVNWIADQGHYPLAMKTIDPSSWPTALDGHGVGKEKLYLPSPAFALYRIAFPGAQPDDFEAPLALRWGFTPQDQPQPGVVEYEGKCLEAASKDSEADDTRLKIGAAIGQLTLDVLRIFDSPGPRQSCPYSFFVSAHTVLDGNSAEGQPLFSAFHQRYVLIGTRLAGSGDVVVSPVHGQLPGVFAHAMALDNLFRDGDSYWRPMPALGESWPLSRFSWDDIVTILLIAILMVLSMWFFQPWRRTCHAEGLHDRATKVLILELTVAFLLVLVVVLALVILHYPPINWIGVSALYGLAITLSGMVEDDARVATQPSQSSKGASEWID